MGLLPVMRFWFSLFIYSRTLISRRPNSEVADSARQSKEKGEEAGGGAGGEAAKELHCVAHDGQAAPGYEPDTLEANVLLLFRGHGRYHGTGGGYPGSQMQL
ncbi:hypothetical protein DL769_006488 [Monosporascus sp. CRB-8-3]|nr:hypothetical protein DL769_006488 [Monosporascus sp. CRB-8-3]